MKYSELEIGELYFDFDYSQKRYLCLLIDKKAHTFQPYTDSITGAHMYLFDEAKIVGFTYNSALCHDMIKIK